MPPFFPTLARTKRESQFNRLGFTTDAQRTRCHRCSVAVLAWQAYSTTEILPPLQNATEMLSVAKGVPYIFLITDGAVK